MISFTLDIEIKYIFGKVILPSFDIMEFKTQMPGIMVLRWVGMKYEN